MVDGLCFFCCMKNVHLTFEYFCANFCRHKMLISCCYQCQYSAEPSYFALHSFVWGCVFSVTRCKIVMQNVLVFYHGISQYLSLVFSIIWYNTVVLQSFLVIYMYNRISHLPLVSSLHLFQGLPLEIIRILHQYASDKAEIVIFVCYLYFRNTMMI